MLRQGRTSSLEADIWYLPECRHDPSDPLCLIGPFSERGRTLTARYPLHETQLGNRQAWKATIPEPSLWTPQAPAYYKLADSPEIIGLRDLRIRGVSFFLADRRWVIRASWNSQSVEHNAWQEADLIPIQEQITQDAGNLATVSGQPFILWADHPTAELISTASRTAAALMLIVPHDCPEAVRQAAHSHILIGTHLTTDLPIPAWAQFLSVSEDFLRTGWQPQRQVPVVAVRRHGVENQAPVKLRTMCDQFQADLVHGANYAGLWLLPETP